jgi:hypothetical protein
VGEMWQGGRGAAAMVAAAVSVEVAAGEGSRKMCRSWDRGNMSSSSCGKAQHSACMPEALGAPPQNVSCRVGCKHQTSAWNTLHMPLPDDISMEGFVRQDGERLKARWTPLQLLPLVRGLSAASLAAARLPLCSTAAGLICCCYCCCCW